ncbi:MAG: ABC transporter permease subunit [Calditrichia bacterium]
MKNTESDRHLIKVYRANRLARYIVSLGGYGVIISIIAILLFLFYQSIPLSFGAKLKSLFTFRVENKNSRILLAGVDQYQEVAYVLDQAGNIRFYHLADDSLISKASFPLQEGETLTMAAKGDLSSDYLLAFTSSGRLLPAKVDMRPEFSGTIRNIIPSFKAAEALSIQADSARGKTGGKLLAYTRNAQGVHIAAWESAENKLKLFFDDPDEGLRKTYDLTASLGPETLSRLAISSDGEKLMAGTMDGEIFWFDLSDPENVFLRENWKAAETAVTAAGFLIGDNSLVIGSRDGKVSVWFPVRENRTAHLYREIHRFDSHQAPVVDVFPSPRNRTFLTLDQKGIAHLNFSTTSRTMKEFNPDPGPGLIQTADFAPKGDGLLFINSGNKLVSYRLNNPHPETTFGTLFSKTWYEGYPEPEFVWQSTGGSNEFEPKLNLIPLIFGTFKGTLYAMLFSIPLALLGAIYISQFSPKWLGSRVKPTIEIMAALPSVVIGFLAGLYFSPLFERHLMTLFLFLALLPVVFVAGVFLWRAIPEEKRMRFPMGSEILFMIPLLLAGFWLATLLDAPLENLAFGGNIQQWLFETLDMRYDQRNSLVVGFALGFAVIPIIFTISEDALSNVPGSLTSASLALGASRWQTVRRVVLPAAAGGIFAAVMLGLGRAIGETMIVLMATGNTPILDLSPFNGFRAMSACIAVEIPEAPVGGTLYRVLFLTAFLLFIFTFLVNTMAALIGDKLRKKYSRF